VRGLVLKSCMTVYTCRTFSLRHFIILDWDIPLYIQNEDQIKLCISVTSTLLQYVENCWLTYFGLNVKRRQVSYKNYVWRKYHDEIIVQVKVMRSEFILNSVCYILT